MPEEHQPQICSTSPLSCSSLYPRNTDNGSPLSQLPVRQYSSRHIVVCCRLVHGLPQGPHAAIQEKKRSRPVEHCVLPLSSFALKTFLVIRTGTGLGILPRRSFRASIWSQQSLSFFLSVASPQAGCARHPYGPTAKFVKISLRSSNPGPHTHRRLHHIRRFSASIRIFFHSVHIQPGITANPDSYRRALDDMTRARALMT